MRKEEMNMIVRLTYRMQACGECGNCDKYEHGKGGCRNEQVIEKVDVIEGSPIGIVKDVDYGFVRIGERLIRLERVALLQVNYGQGFVTEWESNVRDYDTFPYVKGMAIDE